MHPKMHTRWCDSKVHTTSFIVGLGPYAVGL